ncbi:localization factor PodJL [Roseibium hamelinense]|uniref:Localization factor PodJL n=1 Tax=Roseibium hamelinense TaxID=150831 RepID=A0A562STS4_9HYPH|nr:peptidoglycan-binding protein [Roseibium hamelinense]MTI43036.1 hypothetical protein [Roseibium hamelinense]TWI84661.1 localization factor PodJL [Roseibium hamelinense]
MPAWKNREAGRRGREHYETISRNDTAYYDDDVRHPENMRRERAADRIERLTRTATSVPHPRGSYDADETENELEAVADELDRLLSERGEDTGQRRRTQNTPKPRRAPAEPVPDQRLEQVMGALERLDRKVQGLAEPEDRFDEEHEMAASEHRSRPRSPSRRPNPSPSRSKRASEPRYSDVFDDGYFDDEDSHYNARAGRDTYVDADLDADFDGIEDGDHEELVAARPSRMPRTNRRARSEEPAARVYKDLGRRIDALRKPQEEALERVRDELGSLRDALGGLSRGTNEKVGRQNAELRRLSDMVERLRADRHNEEFANEIRSEVSELKKMVGRTNVEGALETLEHGYAHILQRLDELSRASVDPRILKGVTARLNEIEDAFAVLPRSEHMLVLEDRVVAIAERVEELLQRKNHADVEPLRAELREVRQFVEQIDIKGLVEGIDDRMRFVSSRLDDLEVLAREQRGLDTRLSAMEQRMPEPETMARLQGRLEDIVGMMSDDRATPYDPYKLDKVDDRLDDIVGRLERMEQTGPGGEPMAFKSLENRLETIATKIESIEKRANRPVPVLDASASVKAAGGADTKLLAQLQDRLNHLTHRLDQPNDTVTSADLDKLRAEIGAMRASVAAPASTGALEKRINDLAEAVAKGSDGLDEDRIEQLGAKVSALAEQLEKSSHRSNDMSEVATALERIERNLQETRSEVVEIAKEAAREAVSDHQPQRTAEYDEAISSLQNDLRRLLDAAEGSEERTRNTFDGVQSILGSLTERLESLEKSDMPYAQTTSKAQSDYPQPELAPEPIDNEPPHKYAPDYASASMAAAPSESERSSDRNRDRKADFIAAARRAAQAASEEAAKVDKRSRRSRQDEAESSKGKERAGWLRSVLKRNKPEDEPAIADSLSDKTPEAPVYTPNAEPRIEPDAPLAGDRPAPEEETPSTGGGRRRALLYAAAAVVLALGTLQVFKMATSGGDGEQVAATDPAPVVQEQSTATEPEDTTTATAGAPEAESDTVGGTVAATAPPNTASAPAGLSGPEAQTPEPLETAAAPEADGAGISDPAAELAFAPPAAVNGTFADGSQPGTGDQPSAFEPGPAGVSNAGLVSSLPPEEVGPMALRSAAAGGNPAAAFLVGVKYTEGGSVGADLGEAAKWYQKAADQGLPPAQYRLASLYEKGRGVDQDLVKARDWYTRAAEAGNAKAMHNLAVLYAEGVDGAPDFTQAAKWFENAAKYGVKDSLFNLGILYARGLGVEKDLTASYKWFAIAAEQGDRDAAKKRDDVANTMDQAQLANARLAVENFKLLTPDPAANKVVTEPEWVGAPSAATNASAAGGVFDYEAMVLKAQSQLNQLGFDTGTPDGQIGPRTRSAVRAFQRSLGLPETGEIDAELMKELDSQSI